MVQPTIQIDVSSDASDTSSGSEDKLVPLGNLLDDEFNDELHRVSSMFSNR